MKVLFGDDEPAIEIMDWQLMDTVLDQCTTCISHPTTEQWNMTLKVLKEDYVEFYL